MPRSLRRSPGSFRPLLARRKTLGFTLIEILLVVGIMAIVLAMGVPSVVRVLRREPLRQAASDVMEALAQARAQSILHGVPAELIVGVDAMDKAVAFTVALVPEPREDPGQSRDAPSTADDPGSENPAQRLTKPFEARLPSEVRITFLDVNFTDQLKSTDEDVRVRFFANGTADDFTIVLEDRLEKRKVSVDPVTGLAAMEVSR